MSTLPFCQIPAPKRLPSPPCRKRGSAGPHIAKSLREHSEYDEEARSKDDHEHGPDGHAKMGEEAHQATGTIRSNIDLVQPSMNK